MSALPLGGTREPGISARRNNPPLPGVYSPVHNQLVRHFFGRFFDTESLSPQGDPQAGVVQTLGILAVPSAFFVLLFRPLSLWGWALCSVRYLFVLYSMVVMGFVMVFEWDALFLDERDRQILTPAPIRRRALLLAKAVALGLFLSIFLADINFFGVLFWSGVDGGSNTFAILTAHLTAVLAGGLFSALAIASIHGLLATLFRGRLYRRASVAVQTILMFALVMLLFLTPLVAWSTEHLVKTNSAFLYWFPGSWFIGFYEQLRPVTRNPLLHNLGARALPAIGIASVLFVLTFLRGAPAAPPASVAARRRWITLRSPVQNAVFHFITQSITRSVKHRLFLATYGGFGAAVAVLSASSGPEGLLRLPLTLSFVLISALRAAFNFPSELRANWAFQLGEIQPLGDYLAATRKWIVACAIAPLFLLLAPMEFLRFSPGLALFHLAYGATLSLLLLEVMFLGFHKIPFTCAHFPGKVNLSFLAVIYIFGFTTYSRTLAALEQWLSGSPGYAALFFAVVAAALLALNGVRSRRIASTASLDYEDSVDPVVRTLGLSPE